jgi:hypothetical protein
VIGHLHVPAALTRGKSFCAHWICDRVDHKIGLDAVEKGKALHCWGSNPGLPALSP